MWSPWNTTKIHALVSDITLVKIQSLETPDIVAPADTRISLEALVKATDGSVLSDLLFHFDNATAPILSDDYRNRTLSLISGATIDTTDVKFGNRSLNLTASGSYANVLPSMLVGAPTNVTYAYPTIKYENGFTLDCWIKLTSLTNEATLFDASGDDYSGWLSGSVGWSITVATDGSLKFNKPSQSYIIAPVGSITTGAMIHIAVVHDGTYTWSYVNGICNVRETTNNIARADKSLRIGLSSTGTNKFYGFIDELKVIVGKSRFIYGSNFTPPILPYEEILDNHSIGWVQIAGNPVIVQNPNTAYPWFTVATSSGDLNYRFVATIDKDTTDQFVGVQKVFRTPADTFKTEQNTDIVGSGVSSHISPKKSESETPQTVRYEYFLKDDGTIKQGIRWDQLSNSISDLTFIDGVIIQKFVKGSGWQDVITLSPEAVNYTPTDYNSVYRVGGIYSNKGRPQHGFRDYYDDLYTNFSGTIISPFKLDSEYLGYEKFKNNPIFQKSESTSNVTVSTFITSLVRADPSSETFINEPISFKTESNSEVSKTSFITFLILADPITDIQTNNPIIKPTISSNYGLSVTRINGGSIGQ